MYSSYWIIRSITVLIFFTHIVLVTSRQHHIRHHRSRHKRQHSEGVFLPGLDEGSGQWGDWSGSSDCSRTCGGGVAYLSRQCLDVGPDGNITCTGANRKYISCNIQDCPEGSESFRAEQCRQFDVVPFEGRLYNWVPYTKAPKKCELNCMPKGERFYYRHAKKVKDGTPCDDQKLDICVDGVCMSVGCDRILGSSMKEDECRVCGGDGSSCSVVEGVFDTESMQVGYNDILLIPTGATNILIEEVQSSNNYIAIRNSSSHYYLNGNWRIDFARDMEFAGTMFHYERKPIGFYTPETVWALGPTTEAVYIVLLYQEKNPGIRYKYSIPKGVSSADRDSYNWRHGAWSNCTELCGGGIQERNVTCVAVRSKETVPDYLCDPLIQPPANMSCNTEPCAAEWYMSPWTNCTEGCKGGVHYRTVYCKQVKGGETVIVDDELCQTTLGPRPINFEECTEDEECPSWFVGEWLPCSKICDEGKQTRSVICHKKVGDEVEVLDESFCAEEKPEESRTCMLQPCVGVDWMASSWMGCEESCGLSRQSRTVVCATRKGDVVDPEVCHQYRKPSSNKDCEDIKMCKFAWYASQWSECSNPCGDGIQTRTVFCGTMDKDMTVKKVDEDKCIEEKKYSESQNCTGTDECKPAWIVSQWTKCSKPCGGGTKTRRIRCMKGTEAARADECEASETPFTSEECNVNKPCGEDEVITIGDVSPEVVDDEEECIEDYDYISDESDSMETVEGSGDEVGSGEAAEKVPSDETSEESSEESISTEEEEGSGDSSLGEDVSSVEKAIEEEQKIPKKKRCKKKPFKTADCSDFTYGCCPDGFTEAGGPFGEGCPDAMTCDMTKYGCCDNEVTPARGPNEEDCPLLNCSISLYGCCPDGKKVAEGNNEEGCEEDVKFDCEKTEFGCCPDKMMPAEGPNNEGCFECEGSGECDSCEDTKYGCCPDGLQAAKGPDYKGCVEGSTEIDCEESKYGCCPDSDVPAKGPKYEGCKMPCVEEMYGCCDDGVSPAHGPNNEGCCLNTPFGCCPDNIRPAQGENLEGCGCEYSLFGCCPDNQTAARGPDMDGCGCEFTEHKCCPDEYTPAAGPNFQGCACYTYQFGCCPDGVTIAKGPNKEGCGCEHTEFGCCGDRRTPASGPDYEGCGCESSWFGCCPDGVTESLGEDFQGCEDKIIKPGEICGVPKDRGNCRNFTVKWFFDMEYGGCSRFWYGGCDGNYNRFDSQKECQMTCVEPEGMEACYLPRVEGPCDGYYPSWYYNTEHEVCHQFIYGGCLGNNNRYQNREDCEQKCVLPDQLDVCLQDVTTGPCHGNFTRYYFNQEEGKCLEFTYGGCKGNKNNFLTEKECQQRCRYEGRSRDICSLPRSEGSCSERHPNWYFDNNENRCMPFYYSGCGGNYNRFESIDECEKICPTHVRDNIVCNLPSEPGPCYDYVQKWYYDPLESQCKPFYYGGCEGNENRFDSEESCKSRCDKGYQPLPDVLPEFTISDCFLQPDQGPCQESQAKWYYDSSDGVCKQFLYGGCQGNNNRFESRQQCEERCSQSQDICQLPRVIGPCSGSFRQWYYDYLSDTCYQFDYGGCQGNKNRFDSQQHCEQQCQRGTTVAPAVTSPPATITSDICSLDVDVGPCAENILAWYYNRVTRICESFTYGGCAGNANRFDTEEQCERQCGRFRDTDICILPEDQGPCSEFIIKWYHDPVDNDCKRFYYSGCGGNGNRFTSQDECESICIEKDEPRPPGNDTDLSNSAVCRLPVQTGPCSEEYKRWYFDPRQGTCVPFVYGGCAGNFNRFKSQDICLSFCEYAVAEARKEAERTIDTGNEDVCAASRYHCEIIQCPYGIEKYVDSYDCERCQCHDPCKHHVCPEGSKCSVDIHQAGNGDEPVIQAVCRQIIKSGHCPDAYTAGDECDVDCEDDADCVGTRKCCSTGCGRMCMDPVITSDRPNSSQYEVVRGVPPRIMSAETFVETEEGGIATLFCSAQGTPAPTIQWSKDGYGVRGDEGRYKIQVGGSLQIVGVQKQDAGLYACVADNSIGSPARHEVKLSVLVPVSAEIHMDRTQYPSNSDIMIACKIRGYPEPEVQWYKDERIVESTSHLLLLENNTLMIIRANGSDSGTYTCKAANTFGVATAQATISVEGVYLHPNCTDNSFFANCALIVKASYCTNRYYAKFCCKSCTLAGQLPPYGPHLYDNKSGGFYNSVK